MNQNGTQADEQQRPVPFYPEEEAPHLKDYIGKILARRWIVITSLLICVVGTAVYDFIQAPVYRSNTRLKIEPKTVDAVEAERSYDPTWSELGAVSIFNAVVETQCSLMTSDKVIERTNEHFDYLGIHRGLLNVTPHEGTFLVDVTFEWTDPKQTADILNYLIKTYLDEYRMSAQEVNRKLLTFRNALLDDLAPKVQDAFDALSKFEDENDLLFFDTQSQQWSISREHLDNLTVEHSKAELLAEEAKGRLEIIETAVAENRLEEVPEIFEDGIINRLRIDLFQAERELATVQKEFGSLHPEVAAAQSEVDRITNWVDLEKQSFVANARELTRKTRRTADNLDSLLEEEEKRVKDEKAALMAISKKSEEHRRLQNEYDTLREEKEEQQDGIRELTLTLLEGEEKNLAITILSEAKVPSAPIKPQKTRDITLAAIMGLVLGIGLCLLIDYLDTTIKTGDDVEKELELPALGYVPPFASVGSNGKVPPELLVLEKPKSLLAESFRSIRTSLMFSKAGKGLKSILVTSAVPLEGKTTVSVNIAISLAHTGKKVLLIDADLRRPCLHKVFDLGSAEPGLSNLLAGHEDATLEAAIRHVGVDNLRFLPSGPHPPNPAELLGSGAMVELTREMCEQYDHVIFDTPPVLSATDSAIVAQEVDGVVFVARSFRTDKEIAARANHILLDAQTRVLGVVLNNADVPRAGYYGYGGYGNKYYSRYYRYYHTYDYYYSDDKVNVVRKRRRRGSGDEVKA